MSSTSTPRKRVRAVLSAVTAGSLAAAALALATTPTEAAPAPAPAPLKKGYAGAPVNPTPFTITQPDGDAIRAYRFGDALSNGVATVKGDNSIVEGEDGYWRYAAGTTASGKLRASSVIVGRGPAPKASKGLAPEATAVRTPNQAPNAGVGDDKELVILVSFADQDPVGSTPAEWHDEYFGADGSVDAFYDEASKGQFGLLPATETSGTANDGVVGWLELPYDHPDTGVDDSAPDEYVADAISAASAYVDFKTYDTNNDGELTTDELHITVIGAGYETSYSGPDDVCGPSIWGHQWDFTSNGVSAPTVDGVKVGESGYTTFGEFHCDASSNDPDNNPGHKATMGIMAHEFGHDINWPDLYDIDYTSEGAGSWSLMSGGSWGYLPAAGQQPGASPSHPDAWSLYYQGWVIPKPVTAAATDVAVKVGEPLLVSPNPDGVDWLFNETEGDGEYFLLENRQKAGFDASLPGCGVIAYRINETVTPSNTANSDEDNPLVDVIEADGDDVYATQDSDPFPGTDTVLALNGSTTPSTDFHDGTPSGLSVAFDAAPACADTLNVDVTPGVASPPVTRPANDMLAAATTLPDLTGTVSQSTRHATVEPGEPKPAGTGRASVWFRWTALANGTLTVTSKDSSYDTTMALYSGTSFANLTALSQNDDEDFANQVYTSRVSAPVKVGQTYLVNASGYGGDSGDLKLAYSLAVDPTQPKPPAPAAGNDSFDRPVKLKGKKGQATGTTLAAGVQAGEKVFKGKTGTNSVWFTWRAKKSGKVTFEATGSFVPWLAVARGKNLASLDVLKSDTTAPTKVKVKVQKGKLYRIILDGGSGSYTLTWK